MNEQTLAVFETLSGAWTRFTANWRLLLGAGATAQLALLAYVLIGMALLSLIGAGGLETSLLMPVFMVAFVLGGLALTTLLHMGFLGICLALQRGQTPTLSSLFSQRKALGRGMAASFLLSLVSSILIQAAWRLPLAGDVAVGLVAGLSAICVSFAYFFVIDRDRAALNAIEASLRTVWSGGLPVVGLFLCCLGITGVSAMIPLVGPPIGWSITALAYSGAYLRLAR